MVTHYLYDSGGLNRELFELVQRTRSSELDSFAIVFSTLGSFWLAPFYAALIGTHAVIHRRQQTAGYRPVRRWEGVFFRYLVAVLIAGGIVWVAKTILPMPRPADVYGLKIAASPFLIDSSASFPSGHSAAAAALAASLWSAIRHPAMRFLLVLFVASVGVSRVVLGAHFPADVVAGCSVGLLSAWLATQTMRWIDRRATCASDHNEGP